MSSEMVLKPESTKQSMNDTIKLRREVEKIKWWHKIDLGNGVITPGIDITPEKLKWIQMSQNLAGKSVLDIGAWDGFFHLKQNVEVQDEFLLLIRMCEKTEPRRL